MTKLRFATGETFASLKVRNFRLFFAGQSVSQVGNWLTMVAQTLLVLKLTNSGFALGLLAAVQFGPVLVFGAWAGVIADRYDKRKLLMIAQALAMVQSLAMASLAFMGSPPLVGIYAVALAGGFITAFDNPARRSFVVEMVPEANVNNAVSLNSALMTGSRVIGPALAGLLVTTVGFGWTFLLDGISYIAVLVGLAMMRSSELRASAPVARAKGQVRAGLRYARSVPQLWMPLVMMALIGTFAFNFQVVIPIFVTRDLGGSDATFTLLFSWLSLGSLIGALAVARRTSTTVRRVAMTAVGFGAAMVLLMLSPNATIAFLVAPLLGVASIAFMTASTALVQTEAEPSMRGRVLALQAMVFLGSTPIGGPIVGFVTQHYGARYAIGLGAIACLGAGVWGLWLAKRNHIDELSDDVAPEQMADAVDLVEDPPADGRLLPT